MQLCRGIAGVLVTSVLLAGCVHSQPQPDSPAVILTPTADSRADLHAAVTTALGVMVVTLADDALTQSSTLFVEQAARDSQGQPLNGRDLGRPEQFRLAKSGGSCVLIHVGSGRRFDLPHTHCAAP